MAKLKTERIIIEDREFGKEKLLDFKIDINVGQSGTFMTTLPEEVAAKFKEHGLSLSTNGRSNGRPGYFEASSLERLIKEVRDTCNVFVSKTLVSETIIIRYIIETACSYMRHEDKFYPNGYVAGRDGQKELKWKSGTIGTHAQSPRPSGFRLWTEVCYRREYSFIGRANKIDFDHISWNSDLSEKERPNLWWLSNVVSISQPEGKVMEIEATEDVAEFFVNMHKSIFMIAERVREFVTPEGIKALIANKKGPNLLS
jgi:hypothetical protein